MFDVAVYTDTRKDEAIDGIDGFNFQAVSEGITAQDRQVIRDTMLHRPVVGWGVDHDPLLHPPSFAYQNHGGRFYLSRGISTGVTNNNRPGNLLTQAITTPDADDFGSMRPAQLFGARNWNLAKGPGKAIDQWAAPLEVAPEFEAEALCAMVKEDPWSAEHLADYLSMIEQVTAETPKRLVIICSDQLLAQKWIALGTLFVDARRALDVSIRGFVQDPMTTRADIVVGSPEFGPQPDPTKTFAKANVVDLDRKVMGPIERSPSAHTQAEWFLSEDSGEALAAVDLARRWEQFLGSEVATRAAAVTCFPKDSGSPDEWRSAMLALDGLAGRAQVDELFFYGDALLDAAVTYAPSSPADAALAARTMLALLAAGCHELAVGVLLPSLEAVSGIPAARDAWLEVIAKGSDNRTLRWEDAEAREQAAAHATMMADEVTDTQLPGLFTALHLLGVPLSDMVRPRTCARLAGLWATTPGLTAQCHRWEHLGEVMSELVPVLLRSWERGGQAGLSALMGAQWSWLQTSAPLTPLDRRRVAAWHAAADLTRLKIPERANALHSGGPIEPEMWTLVWAGATLPADYEFFISWMDGQHVITAEAGAWLYQRIDERLRTDRPATEIRRLLVRLAEPDAEVENSQLATLAAQTRLAADRYRAALRSPDNLAPHLNALLGSIPGLAALMAGYLGELILTSHDKRAVERLVRASEAWAEVAVRAALDSRRNSEFQIAEAVALALATIDGPLDAPAQAAQDFLQDVCDDRAALGLVEAAGRQRLLDRRSLADFEAFAKTARKTRLKRRFSRAAGDVLGGKDKES